MSILEPRHYIPAGGKAVYWGRFSPLQQYVATPSNDIVLEHISDLRKQFLNYVWFLEGGGSAILDQNTKPCMQLDSYPVLKSKINWDLALGPLMFFEHTSESFTPDLSFSKSEKLLLTDKVGIVSSPKSIEELFRKAIINYHKKLSNLHFSHSWTIDILYYELITVDREGVPSFHKTNGDFKLSYGNSENYYHLIVHIESFVLEKLLKGEMSWNMAIGSLMFFERNPDLFIPDITFSLNYLRI